MNTESVKLFDKLSEQVIAYRPVYARICGCVTGGILLSQLVYWAKAFKWCEFYKTDNELRVELCFSRNEIKSAKKKVKAFGFIKTEIRNYPPKTFYTLNLEKIINAITNLSEEEASNGLNATNHRLESNQSVDENQPIIGWNSANIHTENNTKNNIYRIFDFWNEQNITQHREIEKFKPCINARLKSYSSEEIIQAIKNYKDIWESPEHYYSHKFRLDKFLRPSVLDDFLDREKAFNNFKDKAKGNGRRTQADINSAGSGVVT